MTKQASSRSGLGWRAKNALKGAAAASALAFAGALISVAPAAANYEVGLNAYQKGQYDQAIDIWKRFAIAGDVRSMKVLGDVYSGKVLEGALSAAVPIEEVPVNNVEALKWYTLAAYHDFTAYQQPTAAEVNARILAEQRLSDIRFRMSSANVSKSETHVAQTFERGSPYDIFRLGKMYQSGEGVAKNNAKALQMYALAKARGVGEASAAYEYLEPLMTSAEIEIAEENATDWQPPLPVEHTDKTGRQKELERLKKELEELRLEDSLQAISDIDVELLQRALRSLGFYYSGIDNKMGPQTREAIKRFQYSRASSDPDLTPAQKNNARTGVLSAEQTVDLVRKAANVDDRMSQYVYGIMHVRGIGVLQNGAEATTWLGKSANADLAIAHYALGVLYRDGTTGLNPVIPNKADSALHFARALALGYRPAGEALRLLEFEAPVNVE